MMTIRKDIAHIFFRMTFIDVTARYKGSMLGFLWAFATPAIMLAAYTLVFSYIIGAKWPDTGGSHLGFAINIFCGLILHSFIAEILTRSPGLIPQNANYVKRIIFPLELLPGIVTTTALINMMIALVVFLSLLVMATNHVSASILATPIILIPVLFFGLGISFLLSGLGCYLRDIQQIAPSISSLLLFLSPIFYPTEILSEIWQKIFYINPLTLPIEQLRGALLLDTLPSWRALSAQIIFNGLFLALSIALYKRLKKGFSDVL